MAIVQGEWRTLTAREVRILADVMGTADTVRVVLTPRVARALERALAAAYGRP